MKEEEERETTLENMKFCVKARHGLAQCLARVDQQSEKTLWGWLLGLLEKTTGRRPEGCLGRRRGKQEQGLSTPRPLLKQWDRPK